MHELCKSKKNVGHQARFEICSTPAITQGSISAATDFFPKSPEFRLGLTSLSELQSISDLLDQIGMKGEHKKKALNTFDQHLVSLEQIMTNITDQVTGVANPYLLGGRIVRTASEPHVSYSICFYVALDFRFVEWWTDNQVQNIAGSV